MPTRTLIGLAIGSGFEAADAVAVRVDGSGLGMTPRVAATSRVLLSPALRQVGRDRVRQTDPWPVEFGRELGQAFAEAARQAAIRAGRELPAIFALGLQTPLPDIDPNPLGPAASLGEYLAEQTGLTVVANPQGRDVAAGGSGHLITAAGDALLARDATEGRLLVHLGSVTSVVFIPPGGRLSEVVGFESGPGNRLLDDLTSLGTRGRDECDHGGTRAVQGRTLEPLLTRWLAHPTLLRPPPKTVSRGAFGHQFLTDAFESTRALGGTLNDLLCTATHFVARCVGLGCERWLPPAAARARVLVSGGGSRNGFLWKLLEEQFTGRSVERSEAIGIPTMARTAASVAVLAALTLDGVSANLPLLTRAAGGRLLGRIIPGDPRNWAACTAWMAEQLAGYVPFPRAA